MATAKLTLNVKESVIAEKNAPNTNRTPYAAEELSEKALYAFRFDEPPENVKYKVLSLAQLDIYARNDGDGFGYFWLYNSQTINSPKNITWNNQTGQHVGTDDTYYTQSMGFLRFFLEKKVVNYSATFFVRGSFDALEKIHTYILTDKNTEQEYAGYPRLQIEYEEDLLVTGKISATNMNGGYYNPRTELIPRWTFGQEEYSLYPLRATSEFFQWRKKGEEYWNTIEAYGGQCVVPANTFPLAEIEWRVQATDNLGRDWTGATYTFTTSDSPAVGSPVSPSNTVEAGSGPITFTWRHANNTGTGQTKADLQWSSDGGTWQDLATVRGSGKTYTAPANTFPAGTIYWRVRTYNSDGVAGAWSSGLTFVSVAAPPKPVVAADGKPFTTITWQSNGQLAYSVTVDGVEYGPRFGSDKSLSLRERLENGTHRATVKIQGVYGLWSEAGSVDFQISNSPGVDIKLKVRFDHTALLRWSTEGSYNAYQIYRNGKLIGKTAETSFADNLAIGQCTYQIIGIMADGNYTESNSVKGTINLSCTMICDLERGTWQKLELSAKSYPEMNFTLNQQSSTRHFCGAALPVLELSQFRNKSGSYEVAFKCRKDAEAFEALLGKVVCIKSKPADMIIGGLLDLQKLQGEFYAAYSFSVNAIYWEDYKDDADS